jgi:hypothetical protein
MKHAAADVDVPSSLAGRRIFDAHQQWPIAQRHNTRAARSAPPVFDQVQGADFLLLLRQHLPACYITSRGFASRISDLQSGVFPIHRVDAPAILDIWNACAAMTSGRLNLLHQHHLHLPTAREWRQHLFRPRPEFRQLLQRALPFDVAADELDRVAALSGDARLEAIATLIDNATA